MIKLASFMLVIMLSISSARAEQRADELLWKCNGTAKDEVQAALGKLYCIGYISGLIDGHQITSNILKPEKKFLCLPKDGISNDQAVRIVVKWLNEHPEELHQTARVAVLVALRNAFPCGDNE